MLLYCITSFSTRYDIVIAFFQFLLHHGAQVKFFHLIPIIILHAFLILNLKFLFVLWATAIRYPFYFTVSTELLTLRSTSLHPSYSFASFLRFTVCPPHFLFIFHTVVLIHPG